MIKKILLVFIIELMLHGCSATKLSCTPTDRNNVSQSIHVLKESLKYQSPEHKVDSVAVNHDYIKIISEPNAKISFIHFDVMGGIELHKKGEWKIVTIKSLNNTIMYRLYVESDEVAKNFIDAVYTLKIHSKEIESELNKN
jgi:uncharacterized protein YcfL